MTKIREVSEYDYWTNLTEYFAVMIMVALFPEIPPARIYFWRRTTVATVDEVKVPGESECEGEMFFNIDNDPEKAMKVCVHFIYGLNGRWTPDPDRLHSVYVHFDDEGYRLVYDYLFENNRPVLYQFYSKVSRATKA